MITKQNVYNYLKYRKHLNELNSLKILSVKSYKSFIDIVYEYIENEKITYIYYVQKDAYYKWIISNRKKKIKALEKL